jgi:peroxiredoxin
MKKAIPIIIVLGMLGWALMDYFVWSSDEETEDEPAVEDVASEEIGLEQGMIAPDFDLTTLDGEQAALSDFRGEPVMVNFWATWCPPCRAEMPDMQKLYEDNGYTILALNMTSTETNVEDVGEFVDELGLTFPILMDETADVMENYSIQVYPTSYLIDSSGRVQRVILGAMNYDQMLQQMSEIDN